MPQYIVTTPYNEKLKTTNATKIQKIHKVNLVNEESQKDYILDNIIITESTKKGVNFVTLTSIETKYSPKILPYWKKEHNRYYIMELEYIPKTETENLQLLKIWKKYDSICRTPYQMDEDRKKELIAAGYPAGKIHINPAHTKARIYTDTQYRNTETYLEILE